jgi:hypothetical protein
MRVFLREALRFGNMDIDQINWAEVVCFAFHDDLLCFIDGELRKRRIIARISTESSVFLGQ